MKAKEGLWAICRWTKKADAVVQDREVVTGFARHRHWRLARIDEHTLHYEVLTRFARAGESNGDEDALKSFLQVWSFTLCMCVSQSMQLETNLVSLYRKWAMVDAVFGRLIESKANDGWSGIHRALQ